MDLTVAQAQLFNCQPFFIIKRLTEKSLGAQADANRLGQFA